MLNLNLERILDNEENVIGYNLRQILLDLQDYINKRPLIDFVGVFKEYTFNKAETELAIRHNLGYIPTDVIITRILPSNVNVIIHHEKSTSSYIYISTDNACELRMFIGVIKK